MQPRECLSSGRGVADGNSSIREALTLILRETAADAHRALSEISKHKHRRTKAWRCSCGRHLIPPCAFRALQDVRRRKVLSHFATAFLLESFAYLEEKKAAPEPARIFFADRHASHAWLTVALGINDETVERKSRNAWFVSGGRPPMQRVLHHERSGARQPLTAALNAALERKCGELASRDAGLVGSSLTSSVRSHVPASSETNLKLSTERAKGRGRPRKDNERRRVLELKDQKKSWGEIAIVLNKELGLTKSKDAYRGLARTQDKNVSGRSEEDPEQN